MTNVVAPEADVNERLVTPADCLAFLVGGELRLAAEPEAGGQGALAPPAGGVQWVAFSTSPSPVPN